MKKTVKKIHLHRETLHQLDPEQLTGPFGGTTVICNTITVCRGSCMGTCVCGGTTNCTNSNCSSVC